MGLLCLSVSESIIARTGSICAKPALSVLLRFGSHELKGVMQKICDELTDQGVLKIPQQHNIIVQSVCPSFLRRKRKAANTPTYLLTNDDVRLIINFAPVNNLTKIYLQPPKQQTIYTVISEGEKK